MGAAGLRAVGRGRNHGSNVRQIGTVSRMASWVTGVVVAACGSPAPAPRVPPPTAAVAAKSTALPELQLLWALPIVSEERFQPSGLALSNGKLLTVSDKDDSTVYELVLSDSAAIARPFVRFSAPPEYAPPLDLEGIAVLDDGAMLLPSETHSSLLLVDTGGSARFIMGSLTSVGAGLLRKRNAGLEGVTTLDDGSYLLAAEREPRGLISVDPAGCAAPSAWSMDEPRYGRHGSRSPDFSDLSSFEGQVYALERNAHLVVRLERAADGWRESDAWSFASTENDPELAYSDQTFGLAEGLAMDSERVFVVLDNNQDHKASDPSDRRPTLFVLARPR
jgi:hypothetical protein